MYNGEYEKGDYMYMYKLYIFFFIELFFKGE